MRLATNNWRQLTIRDACRNGKLVAPLTFAGTRHSEVVDTSPTKAKLVEQAGCWRLFLPAYSPNLNSIEHLWAVLKSRLRKGLTSATDPFLFIANTPQCNC